MYKIIGGDKVAYGPETAEQIRAWVADGRANGQTLVQAEGSSEWRPLASFPELAPALDEIPAAAQPGAGRPASRDLPTDIWRRDYKLRIGDYINRSFALFQKKPGLILSGAAIWLSVQIGLTAAGFIPALAVAAFFINLVVAGPLMAGLYVLLLRAIRDERAWPEMVFDGFRERFFPLLFGQVVSTSIIVLAMRPGLTMLDKASITLAAFEQGVKLTPEQLHAAWTGGLAAMAPLFILRLCWLFALPLILDKKLHFLPALHLSLRKVTQHWWRFCALSVVCILINFIGFACCLVGLAITIPLTFLIEMHAYEDVFSA